MEVTRRYWAIAAVGAVLVALSVVFARPLVLSGAAGLAALLLARQYWFLRALETTDDALTVEQSLPSQYVKKDDETPVTLSARIRTPSPLDLTIAASPPLLATVSDDATPEIEVEAGRRAASTTATLSWSIVGRGSFGPATVAVEDPFGLFRETLARGSEPTVVVEPRVPHNVHVGQGGEQVLSSFGGHRSDQFGSGTDPAEIREYVAGDSVSDIDWKATARLDYPHVREYEVETDRKTVLFVDHRAGLTAGRAGETKLDYLRAVALVVVGNASELNDPIGIATIDEGGTTAWEPPGTSPETYRAVRSTLHALTTDAAGAETETGATPAEAATRYATASHSPAIARRKATTLAGDDSPYGRAVRPFLRETEGYVQRMDVDPLFGTVRTRSEDVSGAVWAMLFTDDTDRTQLRETVKLARQRSTRVLVFLTPSVLFERGGVSDLDDAYEAYVDFEEFRRELAGLEGVTALEVGPGDRIEAVLGTGRRQRQ